MFSLIFLFILFLITFFGTIWSIQACYKKNDAFGLLVALLMIFNVILAIEICKRLDALDERVKIERKC